MKLTRESKQLMALFGTTTTTTIPPVAPTAKTNSLLAKFYKDILGGMQYVATECSIAEVVQIARIRNSRQLPKPAIFAFADFPATIVAHITKHSVHTLTYSFPALFRRVITIVFVIPVATQVDKWIPVYNEYVYFMLVWLFLVDMYTNANTNKKMCSKELKVFVYHTALLKQLPRAPTEVLNATHVNTAFTQTCPLTYAEIVVYRKEEWFKVFIHETFHTFALDFSDMNMALCNKTILGLFPIESKVNLYEAYTEFWARIINTLFCSVRLMQKRASLPAFIATATQLIHVERTYSFFQMVKVLHHMGLTYTDLYSSNATAELKRRAQYKEDTNVFAYYVVTSILMNNYNEFMALCERNNTMILNFQKTRQNLREVCEFIKKKYKSARMLENVRCAEQAYSAHQKANNTTFVANNLRMTVCELG